MILREATNIMAYAKVGIYGSAGSGKTYTAVKMAIGHHKKIKSTKPIAVFDTEPAFSFVLNLFNEENIKVLICDSSRSLKDLMQFMDEAEKLCDVMIIDSVTHIWRDVQESFLKMINSSLNRKNKPSLMAIEFHHWRPIKAQWAIFHNRFLCSKSHIIFCGRAGAIYEYQERSDGKKELVTTGTRMATEKELAYEPSLLIELNIEYKDEEMINVAYVQKDRANKINGKRFEMPTFKDFEPHFDQLNLGGTHFESMDTRDSADLFLEFDSDAFETEKKLRAFYAKKIIEFIKKFFPFSEDRSKRVDIMKKYFDSDSWNTISERTPSVRLKEGYDKMAQELEPVIVELTKIKDHAIEIDPVAKLEEIRRLQIQDENKEQVA